MIDFADHKDLKDGDHVLVTFEMVVDKKDQTGNLGAKPHQFGGSFVWHDDIVTGYLNSAYVGQAVSIEPKPQLTPADLKNGELFHDAEGYLFARMGDQVYFVSRPDGRPGHAHPFGLDSQAIALPITRATITKETSA